MSYSVRAQHRCDAAGCTETFSMTYENQGGMNAKWCGVLAQSKGWKVYGATAFCAKHADPKARR